jgi:hypothetical protein
MLIPYPKLLVPFKSYDEFLQNLFSIIVLFITLE